jgi:uncharacterized protein involved in exopolysaccharide biosynthesis
VTRPRDLGLLPPQAPERGSVLNLVNFLLRHPRLVFGLPLLVAIATVLISLVITPSFTAESKFGTQKGTGAGQNRFAGIAAQFGIDLGASSGSGEPLEFYVELLTSQQLLRKAAATTYEFREPESNRTIKGNLVQLYGIKGSSPDAQLRAASLKLKRNISVFPNPRSGLVTLRTGAPWGGLAVALNERLLELVNEFNLQQRQEQASQERQFVDSRVEVAQRELAAAENALKEFNQSNRVIGGSPQLQYEQARLQRGVDLRQQVYVSLAQAYEQARIEEMRNTSVITTVEPPIGTATRRGGVITNGVLALFAGLVVGILLAVLIEYYRHEAEQDPRAAAELRQHLRFWGPRQSHRPAALERS